MSDYHPETWNPLWSVSAILTGLLSFMLDSASTQGSVESTVYEKKLLASKSMPYNRKDRTFVRCFPQLLDR